MITQMKSLPILVLSALLCLVPVLVAADNNGTAPKDAQSVINGMRLKKITKDLDLTDEQQKKVQALFAEEAQTISKLNGDLSVTERSSKVTEIRQATFAKIKPLLTAPQLEKFEKMQADARKPKQKK
jgi:hypothetical protein